MKYPLQWSIPYNEVPLTMGEHPLQLWNIAYNESFLTIGKHSLQWGSIYMYLTTVKHRLQWSIPYNEGKIPYNGEAYLTIVKHRLQWSTSYNRESLNRPFQQGRIQVTIGKHRHTFFLFFWWTHSKMFIPPSHHFRRV
jgi:hypothetical protein